MSQALDIIITDPQSEKRDSYRSWERFFLARIHDERDLPFVHLSLGITLILMPCAFILYIPGVFRWWLGIAYLGLLFGCFFDRYILMLHNVSHRRFFKKGWRGLNLHVTAIQGIFCGQTPNSYYAHHIGMHHPENNMSEDLSSTLSYRRDSFAGFMHYFLRFFFMGLVDLTGYHGRNGRNRLVRRLLAGELGYATTLVLLLWAAPLPTLFVFVLPLVLARFLMMAGNWAQHAFIDLNDPENPYRNSITCINSRYNRRCFNDGYHIGHHVKASRHWTEMPGDFLDNREQYANENAVVFEGVDYFMVWLWLMVKRYDWLARRVVHLQKDRSNDETIQWLRSLTHPAVSVPGSG